MPASSFRSRFLMALGLAPCLTIYPIYMVAIQVHKEVVLPRFLGLLDVAVLGMALVALAAAAWRVSSRAGRWVRPALFAGVIANAAATGLAVFYKHPLNAPGPASAAVALAGLALLALFARKPADEQGLSLRALGSAGLSAIALAALASPYVLAAALHDQPRNPHSPTPPGTAEALPGAPKRIVLVSFDELRRRGTSLADPARDTTPNMAAIAAESTRFTNCHSAGDQTIVSMPTVLTGMRPPDIYGRIHNDVAAIRQGSVSGVAGFLKAAGYRTYYSTMLILPQSFGMREEYDDGWSVVRLIRHPFNGRSFLPLADIVDELTPQRFKPHRVSPMPGDVHPVHSVVEQGLAMYNEPAERSFVWVHMGLPHHPYYRIPKSDYHTIKRLTTYRRVHPFVNSRDPAVYEAAYNEYMGFADAKFGELVAGMKASPMWKDTLLIVTSDHGTHLDPTRALPYGEGVAPEDITHVPLLVHMPGQRTTARVDAAVGHEDIVPTILSQVYPAVPGAFKGHPLIGAPLSNDRIAYTWAVPPFASMRSTGPRTVVAYQGRYKLMLDGKADTMRLVDWQQDPDGRHDLSAAHPGLAAHLKAWLTNELTRS